MAAGVAAGAGAAGFPPVAAAAATGVAAGAGAVLPPPKNPDIVPAALLAAADNPSAISPTLGMLGINAMSFSNSCVTPAIICVPILSM